MAASFFGSEGTEYDLPFAEVDAATIGIELDDFARAISTGRAPEVDGLSWASRRGRGLGHRRVAGCAPVPSGSQMSQTGRLGCPGTG